MTYFIVTTFINALACGLCCILVLVNNFKSKLVKSFALFNSIVALWSFIYFLSMIATQEQEALFYSRTLNTIALFIPPAFLFFCLQITSNINTNLKRLLFLFLAIDICVLPLVPTPYFIKEMHSIVVFKFWPYPGPLIYYSFFQFLILIPTSFYLLRKKILASSGSEKKQYNILFYSLLIAFLGGGTDYFPCLNIPIVPFGNALVSCFVFGFLYLVFKYRMMDINVALSRGFAYTILIFIISVFYFSITHLTDNFLKEITGYNSFIFTFLCASITALAFAPLQDRIQRLVDRLFFKKTIEEIDQENKILKEEVTHSERNRTIALLASGIAHEVRNPLTAIKTFTEYLDKKSSDPTFIRQYQQIVDKEVDRINNLVTELLALAKPSVLNKQPVNPSELITSVLTMLEHKLTTNNIILKAELNNKQIIHADPNQLKQALLNLIINALDAMPNGGTLTIRTKESLENYIIEIEDTGSGIDPKDLPYIFDPFFSKKEKGTGLGLAITKGIVENHNGTIAINSILNNGSLFTITLGHTNT